MANIVITNFDTGSVVLKRGEFYDGVWAATAADTLAEGTILARDTTNNKYVPYVKGGTTNGNGIPKAVLTYEVEATGAGDVPIRPMLNGVVIESRLVIDADGDATNVDAVVRDLLRDFGMVVVEAAELSKTPT